MGIGRYRNVSSRIINRIGDKTMDNFKEISKQKVSSFLIIRDLTDDKIILSKAIKNVHPSMTKGENDE